MLTRKQRELVDCGSVLPLRTFATAERAEEVTVCTSIAGGQQEVMGMPAELMLVRMNHEHREILGRYKFEELVRPATPRAT